MKFDDELLQTIYDTPPEDLLNAILNLKDWIDREEETMLQMKQGVLSIQHNREALDAMYPELVDQRELINTLYKLWASIDKVANIRMKELHEAGLL